MAPPAPDSVIEDIYVATERGLDQLNRAFGEPRKTELHFIRTSVAVPATHTPGAIEWPAVEERPNAATDFVIADKKVFADKSQFVRAFRASRSGTESTVFVHGYNTNTTEAITRLAQIVQDSGYDGIPILFTWPSNRKTIDYVSDINSAAFSRDALVDLAFALNRSNLDEFYIIGHSMGGFLVMEAVRSIGLRNQFDRLSKNSDIILASPDIDIDLFGSQIRPLDFERSKITVLMSQDDKALRLSQRIAGDYPRVGAAIAAFS